MEKVVLLDLPDHGYNWLADFFTGHLHCTVYHGQVSTLKSITVSIIQGSGIGPAAYVVYASDLKTVTHRNQLCKFADDTYLIVPARNVDLRAAEMSNIDTWARRNNLTLNQKKLQEIVFTDSRRRRQIALPLPMADIVRVTLIKILGVTITNGLSASDHVRDVITSCAQTLYALRVLRAHGMCQEALQTIFRSVTIAKLIYASNAWSGFTNATDRQRVNGFLRRSLHCGYCSPDFPTFADQCDTADEKLFNKICLDNNQVLDCLLPPPTSASQSYNL